MSYHKDERNTPALKELLRLHGLDDEKPSQLADVFRLAYWHREAIVARLTAERDAALAGAVKVKPLVWEPHPFSQSTIEECAIADAPFKQRYQIQRDPWATTYIAMLYPRIPISDSTLWWESKGHADMASAREAAQADYEARIRALLPPADLAAKIGGEE